MTQRVCHHFQRGRCRYGSSCRFSHRSTALFGHENLPNENIMSPFSLERLRRQLTEKLKSGMLSGGHSDACVCVWPSSQLASSQLRLLTSQTQTQAQNFVNSGLYALTKDDTAFEFVKELGEIRGRRLTVLEEIIDLEYSLDAGRQRDVMSFQRVLVPLVTMLTMRRMEMISRHLTETNHVYASARTAHGKLCEKYVACLDQVAERRSVEDLDLSHESFLRDSLGRKYAPLSFTQVCLPFIRLLFLLANKFQDVTFEDSFREAVNGVDASLAKWVEHETTASDSSLDSTMCFQLMREEVMRLHNMVRRSERSIEKAATLKDRTDAEKQVGANDPVAWDFEEVGIPERAVLADGRIGRRHDNDHEDITDIQILPAIWECLSREPPLLPGNFPFHAKAHWLSPGTERWVDTHFRLFRDDLCGTIRLSLKDFKRGYNETFGKASGDRCRKSDVDYSVYPVHKIALSVEHTVREVERWDEFPRYRAECQKRNGLCVEVRFNNTYPPRMVQANGQGSNDDSKYHGNSGDMEQRDEYDEYDDDVFAEARKL